MLGEIIGEIVGSTFPVDEELALLDAILYPVKTHVHSFGSALFDGVVGYSCGAGIVGLQGRGWLGMTHVIEGRAEHGGFFAVVEECSKFGFGGGGKDGSHNGGVDVDSTI